MSLRSMTAAQLAKTWREMFDAGDERSGAMLPRDTRILQGLLEDGYAPTQLLEAMYSAKEAGYIGSFYSWATAAERSWICHDTLQAEAELLQMMFGLRPPDDYNTYLDLRRGGWPSAELDAQRAAAEIRLKGWLDETMGATTGYGGTRPDRGIDYKPGRSGRATKLRLVDR